MMKSFASVAADLFFIQEYLQKFEEAADKMGKYYTISNDSKDTLIIASKSTFSVKYPTGYVLSQK